MKVFGKKGKSSSGDTAINNGQVTPSPATSKKDSLVDNGVVVSSENGKKNLLKNKSIPRRSLLIIVCIVLAIAISATYLIISRRNKPSSAVEAPPRDMLQIANNNEVSSVVQQYGVDFDSAMKEVKGAEIAKWDRTMLDKAYFSLLYADKMGAFTQVGEMLSYIEFARKSGINIDDNSYRIDQRARDAIQERATAISQKKQKSQSESSNE